MGPEIKLRTTTEHRFRLHGFPLEMLDRLRVGKWLLFGSLKQPGQGRLLLERAPEHRAEGEKAGPGGLSLSRGFEFMVAGGMILHELGEYEMDLSFEDKGSFFMLRELRRWPISEKKRKALHARPARSSLFLAPDPAQPTLFEGVTDASRKKGPH